MADPFTLLIRVRYGECDAQNVVFNARYADYADLAATEFVRELFGSYQNILAEGMDTQVVNLNINWQAPAKFDDVLALKVQTGKIGNTSYQLKVRFENYQTKQKIADAQITYVVVDTQHYRKMPMPETFKTKLTQDNSGKLIDQAASQIT